MFLSAFFVVFISFFFLPAQSFRCRPFKWSFILGTGLLVFNLINTLQSFGGYHGHKTFCVKWATLADCREATNLFLTLWGLNVVSNVVHRFLNSPRSCSLFYFLNLCMSWACFSVCACYRWYQSSQLLFLVAPVRVLFFFCVFHCNIYSVLCFMILWLLQCFGCGMRSICIRIHIRTRVLSTTKHEQRSSWWWLLQWPSNVCIHIFTLYTQKLRGKVARSALGYIFRNIDAT